MKRNLLGLCCCVLLLNVYGCTDISRYIDTMAAGSTEQLGTVEGTEPDTQLAQKDTETEEVIFQQTFEVDEEGDVAYGESTILPCSVSSRPDCNTYQPTPLEGEEANRVLDRLKTYSTIYEDTIFNQ